MSAILLQKGSKKTKNGQESNPLPSQQTEVLFHPAIVNMLFQTLCLVITFFSLGKYILWTTWCWKWFLLSKWVSGVYFEHWWFYNTILHINICDNSDYYLFLIQELQTCEPATSIHIKSYIDILQVLHSYYQLFVWNYLSMANWVFKLWREKKISWIC